MTNKEQTAAPQVTDEQAVRELRDAIKSAIEFAERTGRVDVDVIDLNRWHITCSYLLLSAPPAAETPVAKFTQTEIGTQCNFGEILKASIPQNFQKASLVDTPAPLVYSNGVAAPRQEAKPVVADLLLRARVAGLLHLLQFRNLGYVPEKDVIETDKTIADIKRMLAAAPQEQAPARRRDIFGICDAYESGIGHGLQQDGLDLSRTPHGDPEHGEAYQIGYELGVERAQEGKKGQAPSSKQCGYASVGNCIPGCVEKMNTNRWYLSDSDSNGLQAVLDSEE